MEFVFLERIENLRKTGKLIYATPSNFNISHTLKNTLKGQLIQLSVLKISFLMAIYLLRVCHCGSCCDSKYARLRQDIIETPETSKQLLMAGRYFFLVCQT